MICTGNWFAHFKGPLGIILDGKVHTYEWSMLSCTPPSVVLQIAVLKIGFSPLCH